jgi:2-polyprenyl-3-methyl-5-hydroxy-6-metoxy-1,4-benzoquinol methylase
VEPSLSLVHSAPEANNVELIQGTFPHPQLRGHTFDIICLVDVIEHVADPVGLLRECAGSLTPNGIVMVVTPDVGSVAAGLMRKRWWHFRLAHVGYFNYRSMKRAADEAGLVISRCFRAKWFFTIGYLADRLTRYLPLNRVNEFARRTPVLQKLYARVVPVNLRDSMVLFLKRRKGLC